jgi:hypothetical protein
VQLLPRYENGTQRFEYTKGVLRRTGKRHTSENEIRKKYDADYYINMDLFK